jgi:methionine aminotransferase
MIIINSPHNPTGSLFDADDLAALAELTRDTDIVCSPTRSTNTSFSTARSTQSVAAIPNWPRAASSCRLSARPITSPAGRSATCWARRELMREFRKVHQFNVFTVNTPCQLGIAEYMRDASRHLGLAAFYQEARVLPPPVGASRFELLPCRGTYFQLARYSAILRPARPRVCRMADREVGVAVIPVSVFNHDGHDDRVVRFCFAKQEATLAAAGENCAAFESR